MPLPSAAPTLVARLARPLATALLVAILAACASRSPAPVEERSTARTARPPPPPTAPAATPAPPAPAEAPIPTYTVKRGDTLYQIALDNGLDYRDLAAWNNIDNINVIRVGQVLRLNAPGTTAPPSVASSATTGDTGTGVTTAPLRTAPAVVAGDGRGQPSPAAPPRSPDNYKSAPKVMKEPYSEQAVRDLQRLAAAPANTSPGVAPPAEPPPVPSATPTIVAHADATPPEAHAGPASAAASDDEDARLNWMWPAEGKIITGFSDTANLKGIDIAGKSGQPVFASAAGKVVYAGTGLRGYGKLIIVKHNNTYLSAYAHNKDILVREGQQVTRGQKIAEMGNTDSEQVMLHFEIRKQGKPMDPLKFLPPA